MKLAKLLVNDKITASCQTNMSQKPYIKHFKRQKWTLKNCQANNFSKTTIAVRFNPLHVCPFVPPQFLFAVLFIPSCYLFISFFNVSFKLVTVPTVWILVNFVTQLLWWKHKLDVNLEGGERIKGNYLLAHLSPPPTHHPHTSCPLLLCFFPLHWGRIIEWLLIICWELEL